jgi:hypothetical protein
MARLLIPSKLGNNFFFLNDHTDLVSCVYMSNGPIKWCKTNYWTCSFLLNCFFTRFYRTADTESTGHPTRLYRLLWARADPCELH